jgi:hypothetical protein
MVHEPLVLLLTVHGRFDWIQAMRRRTDFGFLLSAKRCGLILTIHGLEVILAVYGWI